MAFISTGCQFVNSLTIRVGQWFIFYPFQNLKSISFNRKCLWLSPTLKLIHVMQSSKVKFSKLKSWCIASLSSLSTSTSILELSEKSEHFVKGMISAQKKLPNEKKVQCRSITIKWFITKEKGSEIFWIEKENYRIVCLNLVQKIVSPLEHFFF